MQNSTAFMAIRAAAAKAAHFFMSFDRSKTSDRDWLAGAERQDGTAKALPSSPRPH